MMYEMPPRRMFIDMGPPEDPERGDVWIRLGEWRIWEDGKWEPPWKPSPQEAAQVGISLPERISLFRRIRIKE